LLTGDAGLGAYLSSLSDNLIGEAADGAESWIQAFYTSAVGYNSQVFLFAYSLLFFSSFQLSNL
jgi:hypothetical protein